MQSKIDQTAKNKNDIFAQGYILVYYYVCYKAKH